MPALRGATGWDFATTSDAEWHGNRGCCRHRSRSRGRWGDRCSLRQPGTGRGCRRWNRPAYRQRGWCQRRLWSFVDHPTTLRYCLSAVYVRQGQPNSRLSRGLHFSTTSPVSSLATATALIVFLVKRSTRQSQSFQPDRSGDFQIHSLRTSHIFATCVSTT